MLHCSRRGESCPRCDDRILKRDLGRALPWPVENDVVGGQGEDFGLDDGVGRRRGERACVGDEGFVLVVGNDGEARLGGQFWIREGGRGTYKREEVVEVAVGFDKEDLIVSEGKIEEGGYLLYGWQGGEWLVL